MRRLEEAKGPAANRGIMNRTRERETFKSGHWSDPNYLGCTEYKE